MKKLIVAVVLLAALVPTLASATTYPILSTSTGSGGSFREFPDNDRLSAPGYTITLPALAQGDSVVAYLPFRKFYCPSIAGTDPPEVHICYDMDFSAAADSAWIDIAFVNRVGVTAARPFSAALASLTITRATPFVCKVSAAVSTLPPMPLCKFIFVSKGGTAIEVGRKLNVSFPRQFPIGTKK